MDTDSRVVKIINGINIYFDDFLYYIIVRGKRIVIDEKMLQL